MAGTKPLGVANAMKHDDDRSAEQSSDPTPVVGSATDVAPLGRDHAKPQHELTADEDRDVVDWSRIAAGQQFRGLVKAKQRFIIPATLFFIVYFFALPILVGYAPDLMNRRVFGSVNVAYLYALTQFFMAWIIALLYVRAASRHDRMARKIVEELGTTRGGK
ncbi:MAG: hypothetical protein QOJ64_705 [Acidobacteriota bacterium]|jgi:uncharacterized membrane protein (DUF485 family)|nr:hypothetical protein [Acidobacteriota bacterium]